MGQTFSLEENQLVLTKRKKTLFRKEKVQETVIDLSGLHKISVLINKPTNVVTSFTLYVEKKKYGIYFDDKEQCKELYEFLKEKYPAVEIEEETAGLW